MCTCTNAKRCTYSCLLHLRNLQATKNMCTCRDGVLYFCLLYLCNRCRCDDVEDGTTDSETFCSGSVRIFCNGSVLIFKMRQKVNCYEQACSNFFFNRNEQVMLNQKSVKTILMLMNTFLYIG